MARSLAKNRRALASHRSALAPGRELCAILLTEHFGDIVACEPVVACIRQRHPQCRLLWIVRSSYASLLQAHPHLDGCLEVTCLTEALLLADSTDFDHVYNLHVGQRTCGWFGTVNRKHRGDPSVTLANYLSHGSLLEAFCKSAGLPALDDAPVVHLPVDTAAAVDRFALPGRYFVVHATANEPERAWEAKKWLEFLQDPSVQSAGPWVEVGLHPVIHPQPTGVVNLCGRLTLPELAEVIRRASGFVGIESGPAHLANAFRRPSIILVGRYRNFSRYLPYTGFLRTNAESMLLYNEQGPATDIPVSALTTRFVANFGSAIPH